MTDVEKPITTTDIEKPVTATDVEKTVSTTSPINSPVKARPDSRGSPTKDSPNRNYRELHQSRSVNRPENPFAKNSEYMANIKKTYAALMRNKRTTEAHTAEGNKSQRIIKPKTYTDMEKDKEKEKTVKSPTISKSTVQWAYPKQNAPLNKVETDRFSPYIAKHQGDVRRGNFATPSTATPTIVGKGTRSSTVAPKESTVMTTKTGLVTKDASHFIFALGKGNNDTAIRKALLKRYWWKEAPNAATPYDMCWHQGSRPINFAQLNAVKSVKRMANHFEFNREIGIKSNLLRNLQAYCDKNNLDLFKITPVTFLLDLFDPMFNTEMATFTKFFSEFANKFKQPIANGEATPAKSPVKSATDLSKSSPTKRQKNAVSTSTRVSQKQLSINFPATYYNGTNLWLLKPIEYNRGRGINLFNKLPTLDRYLKSFKLGEDESAMNSPYSKDLKVGSSSGSKSASTLNLVKSHKFVVQKYVERPLLVEGRKFDTRIWVMVDHEMNLYYFKEGYLRLSSEPFTLDENLIEDKYVHLTNNAIQKYGKNYGKHENGNIVPFNDMEKYIPKENAKDILEKIRLRIKELIKLSMDAVRTKLNACDRKFCFEIFGYDFLIDEEFNCWIIEVNSNPSIEESNALLEMLVPRMIDDAFKLTVDKVFNPASRTFTAEEQAKQTKPYSVLGYADDENIWEQLGTLKEPLFPSRPAAN